MRCGPVDLAYGVLVSPTELGLADLLPLARAAPVNVNAQLRRDPGGPGAEEGVHDVGEIEEGIVFHLEVRITPPRVDAYRLLRHRVDPEDTARREQIGQVIIQVTGVEVME